MPRSGGRDAGQCCDGRKKKEDGGGCMNVRSRPGCKNYGFDVSLPALQLATSCLYSQGRLHEALNPESLQLIYTILSLTDFIQYVLYLDSNTLFVTRDNT
jgi:hypothetical protein